MNPVLLAFVCCLNWEGALCLG